jgi:predicted DNA-binding transcriptional regulator YafY
MSRSKRLFDLLQALRRRRTAVSGVVLAQELGVSLRTVRRDVATLQSLGADIKAEAGVGYALQPGLLLPPLAFTEEELHALALGAELISQQTDAALSGAVRNAIAKIEAVLVPHMHHALDGTSFYVASTQVNTPVPFDLKELRRALREQRKLQIRCKVRTEFSSKKSSGPSWWGFRPMSKVLRAGARPTLNTKSLRQNE